MFRVFDVSGVGYVKAAQFNLGLKRLGLYAEHEDILLLINRLSKDSPGIMK